MKISCDVIRDLLPLYAEDMVSEDSRKIVDAHLCHCSECRDSLTEMRGPIEIPRENGESLRAAIERTAQTIIVTVMAVIMVAVTLVGLVFGVLIHPIPGTMEDVLVSVTEHDGQIAEELTLLGATRIKMHYQKDQQTGKKIKYMSYYSNVYSLLFGTTPVSDETYINDYLIDDVQAVWFYEDGKLIHLWGDETTPPILTETGSPWLWWTLGLGTTAGLLAWGLRKKKLGYVALFLINVAISDLITTGGNWFVFTGTAGESLFLKIWLVILAFMLTFSITVCSYLWRNRKSLFY